MKFLASIIIGVILPLTFATPANAAHLDAYVKGYNCTKKGDTVYRVKVTNSTKKARYMNWSLSKTSKGYLFGYDRVNKFATFSVKIPDGESATVSVWSRLNQKTLLLEKELHSVECFQ